MNSCREIVLAPSVKKTVQETSLLSVNLVNQTMRRSYWVVKTDLLVYPHRPEDLVKFSTTRPDTNLQCLGYFHHLSHGMHSPEAPEQSIVALQDGVLG